jgi:HAE1 family hydrophobic/amphiphilic exporter-1
MATTLAIVAVFVPVAFMEGIIGRFFYQFGLTVAWAVLVSLFVSFTLTPMLSAWWGRQSTYRGHARRQRDHPYDRGLQRVV